MILKIYLNRNLRKCLLQGQSWVYKDSIQPTSYKEVSLCQVHDKKGFIAWAFYDPNSVLALRILSTKKNTPDLHFLEMQFLQKLDARKHFDSQNTNAFRLINGEGDYFPGLICDIYNDTAVVQFDGLGPEIFWKQKNNFNLNWIFNLKTVKNIILKSRHIKNNTGQFFIGDSKKDFTKVKIKENKLNFLVNLIDGQKTGFFLDQRDNRQYVKNISNQKTLLNLFSYTGAFSIYAGSGGAKQVCSVDLSKPALNESKKNWELNDLEKNTHSVLCVDILEWLKKPPTQLWDIVIVDPPSMAKSKDQKDLAIKKYTQLFSKAMEFVKPGGDLILSSCSSHIHFSDFQEIINQALSLQRKKAQVFCLSSQGLDHPYLQAMPESRYLKFTHLKISS